MRDDEVGALVTVVALVAIGLGYVIGRRRRSRGSQRLDILQQALQRPDLDPGTRAEILRVLANDQQLVRWLLSPMFWQRIWFGVGWMTFLVAGGLWLWTVFDYGTGLPPRAVAPFAMVGLAMLTLPHGLRELSNREQRAAQPRR